MSTNFSAQKKTDNFLFLLLTIHPRILTPGFALIIVVLITGIFSFVQENKETEVRKEFDRLIPEKATVIR
jgi:hypothetical protein